MTMVAISIEDLGINIHREENKWDCCFGLPYAIYCWQVGDSSKQYGYFKMVLAKAKQERGKRIILLAWSLQ
jgi:hypothetical protein